MIIEDYKIENCSTEDLIEDVPTHQPRFIVKFLLGVNNDYINKVILL